jgi:hypothetical protein
MLSMTLFLIVLMTERVAEKGPSAHEECHGEHEGQPGQSQY